MSRSQDEQAIALAAMFQAAALVDQIANRGMSSQTSFETSINSLFQMNPSNTEEIYGGRNFLPHNLSLGIKTLSENITRGASERSSQINYYVISMIMLEQKVAKDSKMLSTLGDRLVALQHKSDKYFSNDRDSDNPSYTHTNVIAGLEGLYQDTISTFSFRIKVQGDPRHLQNSENAAKVRALLLAGIRAAILWRQVGGKRWHLLFFKARLKQSLAKISKV